MAAALVSSRESRCTPPSPSANLDNNSAPNSSPLLTHANENQRVLGKQAIMGRCHRRARPEAAPTMRFR
jgi:hypothetical protein